MQNSNITAHFYKLDVCCHDQLERDLSGRKVALVTEGMQCSDKNVRDVISGAMAHFRAAGIMVEEVSIPWHNRGTCVTS